MIDIMIVEDNPIERERLSALLSESGYSVVARDRADEAEKILTEDTVRLAILDIGLIDRSGSSLFASLKASGRVSKVIIMTGNPSVSLKQRLLAEGASAYLIKGSVAAQPFNLMTLVEELIGAPSRSQNQGLKGIPLTEFLDRCVANDKRGLFVDAHGQLLRCSCGNDSFVVVFDTKPQCPPEVVGVVTCVSCGLPLDPVV
jgi:DNA-binding response OmpR family regulator